MTEIYATFLKLYVCGVYKTCGHAKHFVRFRFYGDNKRMVKFRDVEFDVKVYPYQKEEEEKVDLE